MNEKILFFIRFIRKNFKRIFSRMIVEFSVNFIDAAGIRERRAVFFEDF